MAFDSLSGKLKDVLKKLTGRGALTESDIKAVMRDVRMALLEADVNYKVAKEFVKNVSEKALGEEVLKSLTPGQQVVKIVHEELTALMGGENAKLAVSSKLPTVIVLCGLQGAGKTTFAGKLALYLKKQGKKPYFAACDIYRPAAVDQLKVVAQKCDVPVYSEDSKNAAKIAKHAVKAANDALCDTVIIDTAGRLHVDEDMMQEIQEIVRVTDPAEILLVLDAMTGQDAVNIATTFDQTLPLTGLVLTKLDGDTRGGAALSLRAVTGKPIKFVSVGEKLDALERFHPERMASRILGMGDMLTLIERAQEAFDAEQAERMEQKLKNTKDFTLDDYLEQFEQMRKMGGAGQIASMIPGIRAKDLEDDDKMEAQMRQIEAIVRSMTPKERKRPEIINASRRKRIAKGSGTSVSDVNRMINQFQSMKKMMKQMMGMGKKRKFGLPF